jgi:RimJ/RimL family protein N-acetyltransferase
VTAVHAGGFETERLRIRALEPADLEPLLDVYLSNPRFLDLTEGSGGEPGRYDLGMLERDVIVAAMTPGRHLDAVCRKRTGELVGLLDWLEESESDGTPWIGLLMIRAGEQRQGLATELFEGFAQRLRANGAAAVRAGVLERNAPGRALCRRLGFKPISTTSVRMASAEKVQVLERTLLK